MTTPIRVLIVDDEPAARRTIHLLLAGDPECQILEDCCDGMQAAETILRYHPDLVFLDIQMPRLDGFEVVGRLPPGSRPLIIFVTAYDAYSLRAFDVHATDYLLKPFSDDRFRAAVSHAKERLRQGPAEVRGDHMAIPTAQGAVLVRIEDIEWVEARGDYVRIYSNGRADLLRETISGVERGLPPSRFVRIHRSSIVNIAKVKEIRRRPGGDQVAVLQSGVHCRLSRSGRERLGRLVGRM
jgi:two-component system LytT family response regulator